MTNVKRRILAASIFPLLLIILSLPISDRWIGPYQSDPEYSHMFNGLMVLELKVPMFRDHPGATLQTLTALVHRIAHPFSSNQEILEGIFKDPQASVRMLTFIWITLCSILIALSGLWVAEAFNNTLYGILFQLGPFLNFIPWAFYGRFAPEAFVIACCLVVCAAAVRFKNDKFAVISAMAMAGVMGTKFNGFTSGIIPLVLLYKDRKNLFKFIKVFTITFLICIAPFFLGLKSSIKWMIGVLYRYGYGADSSASLARAIYNLIFDNPNMLLGIVMGIVGMIYIPKYRKQIGMFWAVIIVQILFVSGSPTNHYLAPGFVPLGMLLIYPLHYLNNKKLTQIVFGGVVCITTIMLYIILNHSHILDKKYVFSAHDKNIILKAQEQEGCALVHSYTGGQMQDALLFGDVFTARMFRKLLYKVYPNVYFFWEETYSFIDYMDQPVSLNQIKALGPKICFPVGRWGKPYDFYKDIKGVKLTPIVQTNHEGTLYRMEFK